jgi:hypothetical protein
MLSSLGISPKLKTLVGLSFGLNFFRDYYAPCEGGSIAVVVGVVEDGDLVDLAAVELPSQRVATRLGVGRALGFDAIERVRWHGGILRLVDRPVDWLRDPDGVAFIIDWSVAAFTLADLDHPVTTLANKPIEVCCSSLALAERVDAAFLRQLPIPRLTVAP